MNAGLRAGYKLTEVGLIPEDWEVKRIGDIASVGSGGTPRREVPAYWGGSIPWITTSQVDFGAVSEAGQFITDEGLQNSPAKLLPPGTLLMALYGQGKTRGKVGVLAMQAATNQACASISLYQGVSREFVLHFLTSRYEQIRKSSNSGSQENLNGNIVKGLLIASPSPTEQHAIATALSDVDALLAGLDRLIAKKRDLKQAAIQQLLTGQTRLPGFQGEWEVKRLGELGTTYGGLTGKSKNDFGSGTAKYVTFMNVMTNTVIDESLFEPVRVIASESQNQVRRGDLLFNGSSETPEEVALCSLMTSEPMDLYLNSFCFGFRASGERQFDGLFLTFYIRSSEGREIMKSLAQGSTRHNISKKALLAAEVRLPTLAEQTAIATVLSDMDAELSALQARRDKTRALKQAMMQELLTGRIRLV